MAMLLSLTAAESGDAIGQGWGGCIIIIADSWGWWASHCCCCGCGCRWAIIDVVDVIVMHHTALSLTTLGVGRGKTYAVSYARAQCNIRCDKYDKHVTTWKPEALNTILPPPELLQTILIFHPQGIQCYLVCALCLHALKVAMEMLQSIWYSEIIVWTTEFPTCSLKFLTHLHCIQKGQICT